MFWYHWLGGDNVLSNELIKSILIRVQVKISRKCIYEKLKLKKNNDFMDLWKHG
jgi:hypothetical protein